MKNIHWLLPCKVNHNDEILKSMRASVRLRSGLFNFPLFKDYSITFSENINNIDNIDYLFVGKIDPDKQYLIDIWINYINSFRDKNPNIFFDYTDHHLSQETLTGQFYRKSLKPNDQIITSSEKLKNYLTADYKNVTIIEDPIEIEIQKVKKNKTTSFLFFGHETNLKFLLNLIPTWDKSREYTLLILTSNFGLKLIQEQSTFILANKPNNLNLQLHRWSIPNMLYASKNVSGIVIPGDKNDEKKNGVSHNRLITAFALGLPVAATRYQSYLKFDHQFVDIDDKSEFENFLKNPSLYSSHVEMAQKKVKNYTKENIAKKWLNLIK